MRKRLLITRTVSKQTKFVRMVADAGGALDAEEEKTEMESNVDNNSGETQVVVIRHLPAPSRFRRR